jgi:hypothetical protein
MPSGVEHNPFDWTKTIKVIALPRTDAFER